MYRVFICAEVPFPRASAGANYIQYIAKSLLETELNTVIISVGKNRECDKNINENKYSYNEIMYDNIDDTIIKKSKLFPSRKLIANEMIKKLIEYNFSEEDYIIYYGNNLETLKALYSITEDNHLVVCRVEMLKSYQFKLGILNPNYINYQRFYNFVYKNIKKTLPISTVIEEYEKSKGCKTLLLPIMSDPFEYINNLEFKVSKKIKLIYSGAKKTNFEDEIKNMIIAFSRLEEKTLDKLEFHITGTNRELIENILGKKKYILDKLKNNLIIHEWLEYDELINLYKSMDYLFLARKDNQITRANFPSKVPEVLSFGIIPICSNVGDYTNYYLCDDYDSIIFEGCSVDACMNALNRILDISIEDKQRMKYNARKTSIDKFYYKKWGDKIKNFIINQ